MTHDIPEDRIRERYDRSRENLIRLLPHLTELRVFDNSVEADPSRGAAPRPLLVLHMLQGEIVTMCFSSCWVVSNLLAKLTFVRP